MIRPLISISIAAILAGFVGYYADASIPVSFLIGAVFGAVGGVIGSIWEMNSYV